MSATAIAAIGLIMAAIALATWSVVGTRVAGKDSIVANLSRGLVPAKKPVKARNSVLESFAGRFTPRRLVANLDRQLALAGRPPAWPLKRLMAAKFAAAGIAVVVGLLLIRGDPSAKTLWLSIAVTMVGYFLPDLLIYSRGLERQATIGLELPDMLDQMTIAVEAGLGFDAAMSRTGQNGKGPLAAELVRTLQDMHIGMSRREAYLALADRTGAPDLRRFVNAILQADRYGISISAVLRTQASEMRRKRRQRAEEQAMKIPVKVLFPLMLCILPVLFIALLGPAVINAIATFSGL
ncbi:type II secretion system F family protein [Arthrobacter sp. AL08]|uniref:type II secretion system F family protein n=1 Tax=unclassified Arthrobacter TaxID=235627 RepID=UPI00249C175C|nr:MULTISPECIES: type II secretion system F family protein [unclassified Arthrobacter]MDI3241427.1 type II secretion system F family protein [Arthrobacter sp. AL05]MDI3277316.1 type II secretion system F family protein [Arthrobacter sp. AL08]